MKNIFKEIIIVLLLIIAIILLLGILLSDYIPTSVTVPAKIQAYEMPLEIQEELKETLSQEDQKIIKTYYIDSTSLSVYEYTDSYDKGKVDPFTSYNSTTSEPSTSTANTSSNGNTNSSTSTNSTGTGGNEGSTGTYFNTTGKN